MTCPRNRRWNGRSPARRGSGFARLCAVLVLALSVPGIPGLSPSGTVLAGDGLAGGDAPGRDSTPDPDRARNLKGLGLSLLAPGLAHLNAGERTRGTLFLVAEAGFWTAFAAYRVQGGIRKDSYIEMAKLQAGVERPEERDEEYYRRIGNWPSSDMYNDLVRRDARDLYDDDLAGRAAYFEANKVPADEAWEWESDAAMDRYRQKRNDSRSAYRRGRNILALAAANRLVAVVDFALLSQKKGRSARVELIPGPTPNSAEFRFSLAIP